MRIAVTAQTDQGLQAPVAPHFGRSPYFVVMDTDAAEVSSVEVLANPFVEGHWPGEVPQFISDQRAEVMLTSGMGARAIEFLTRFGIEPVTGTGGTVAEAVASYLDGRVLGADPCTDQGGRRELA